jgi:hypothetical protein
MRALLVLVGLVALTAAAFMVAVPLGLAVLGGSCILTALTTPSRPKE